MYRVFALNTVKSKGNLFTAAAYGGAIKIKDQYGFSGSQMLFGY